EIGGPLLGSTRPCTKNVVKYNKLVDNTKTDNVGAITLFVGCHDNTIRANEIVDHDETGMGIYLIGTGNHENTIVQNVIRGQTAGIAADMGADRNVIDRNQISDTLLDGMSFNGGLNPALTFWATGFNLPLTGWSFAGNQIHRNTVRNSGCHGVALR